MGQCAREAAVNCKYGLDADMHVHRTTHRHTNGKKGDGVELKLSYMCLHVLSYKMLSVTQYTNKGTFTDHIHILSLLLDWVQVRIKSL